jgi:hypothetical protein
MLFSLMLVLLQLQLTLALGLLTHHSTRLTALLSRLCSATCEIVLLVFTQQLLVLLQLWPLLASGIAR